MVKIFQKGARIEYTQGDTFLIRISPEDDDNFLDGYTLELIVADESSKTPKIQNTYNLTDGAFIVSFSSKDRKIPYGEYIYKIVLRTVDGMIVTQKSGVFKVIWGAGNMSGFQAGVLEIPGMKIEGVIDTYTRKQADEKFQEKLSAEQLANIEDVANKMNEGDADEKFQEKLTNAQLQNIEKVAEMEENAKDGQDGYTPLTIIEKSQLDTSGTIADSTVWSRTDHVHCSGLEYIVLSIRGATQSSQTRGYFYDAEHTPLQEFKFNASAYTQDLDFYFDVPKNAEYFIMSGHHTNIMSFLKMKSPKHMDLQYAKNGVVNLDRESRNFQIIPGRGINNDGTINQVNFGKCITNFIPCKNDDVLYIDISLTVTTETQKNHWFYDVDKNPISKFALKVGKNEIPVPENAEYFILSAYLTEEEALRNAVISTTIRTDLDKIIGDLTVNMSDTWLANAQTSYNSMLEKMKELSYDGIPFFIQTDAHGLSNDPAKWVDNADKRVKNLNLGDIVGGNFNVANAKAYCDSTERLVNLISVYGNHDATYDSASDELATYYALNEYYTSSNRRSKDRHGYFAVADDLYNVKYVILCPYYLTADGTDKGWKFEAEQMKWLIEELTKNDGYDIVILMHEPLIHTNLVRRDGTTYSYTDQQDGLYSRVWDMLVKRKKKESGSITDSDGTEHQYDFTNCTSDYLCSLHGHTHRELYYTDEITAYIGDYYAGERNGIKQCICTFGIVDRLNRKLFIYKFDKETVYDTWELTI